LTLSASGGVLLFLYTAKQVFEQRFPNKVLRI